MTIPAIIVVISVIVSAVIIATATAVISDVDHRGTVISVIVIARIISWPVIVADITSRATGEQQDWKRRYK